MAVNNDPGSGQYQPPRPLTPGGSSTTTAPPSGGTTAPPTTTAPATPQTPQSQSQANAYAVLYAQFKQYGLESLAPVIMEYIRQGYSGETVAIMLRDTPEYKQRFPAMEALRQSGRAINEVDYVNYEINAAQLEQKYGMPKGFLTDSQTIARLLTNNVAADDLRGRVELNAAASMDAPPELRQTLSDYYGLDAQGALTAYYLDPDHSLSYLERQMATAKIGAAARRQSLAIGLDTAEGLRQRGVTEQQADQGFAQVAALQRLQYGDESTVGQSDLVEGAFGDAQAAQRVQQAQQGRRARFGGGGGAVESQQGISGLGR